MKITLMVLGKTDVSFVQEGIQEYIKRISFFCPFEIKVITAPKNHGKLSPVNQMEMEAKLFNEHISSQEMVVLLDEKGKSYSSSAFARQLELWLNSGKKQLVFIVGGAYGIDASMKQKYPSVSISTMTFNHQIIRLIFAEQLYRAFTIIKGLPYHNE